jgi:hypothetical protein
VNFLLNADAMNTVPTSVGFSEHPAKKWRPPPVRSGLERPLLISYT